MKKLVSSALSAAMLASMLPFTASADDSIPDKCLYFKPKANSELTIESDGTVVLSRETIKKLGYTMPVDIFFYDKAATCWYVSPKWKCASGFIKIQNVVDPLPIKGEKLAYAYALADENGNIIDSTYSVSGKNDPECNTAYFTCQSNINFAAEALVPYGERTDSYPLTSFDAKINMNIPYGDYSIYFLTQSEDYEDQRISAINSIDVMKERVPEVKELKIRVEGANLGDIDNNGTINSIDASRALAAYSSSSTGAGHGLTALEFEAADIDKNGQISSTDASEILGYYSYLATTNDPLDFADFRKAEKENSSK